MGTTVAKLKLSSSEVGTKINLWNQPENYGPIIKSYDAAGVSITVNSISSTFPTVKKLVVVPFRPRSPRVVFPPTRPTLRLPLSPFLDPRRLKQSEGSWKRAVSRYTVKYNKWEQLVSRKQERFNRSLAKYFKRLAAYTAYQHKLKYGTIRERDVKVVLIETKDLPWHPYSRDISFYSGFSGTYSAKGRVQVGWPNRYWLDTKSTITGYMEDYFRGPANLSSDYLNEVRTKLSASTDSIARTRLRNKTSEQSVHLGNIFAERQQTYDLIASNGKQLLKMIATFSWKSAARNLKDLVSINANKKAANRTLEFLFGAKPLMADIESAVELLRKEDDGLTVLRVRGSSSRSEEITWEDPYSTTTSSSGFSEVDVIKALVWVRTSYVVEYDIAMPHRMLLQQLGLVNLAEVVWEKMPWSFVIDWLIPFGNWIRSFTATTGLEFSRGVKTVTTRTTYSVDRTFTSWFNYPSQTGEVFAKFHSDHRLENKTRTLLSETPSYDLPKFKNPLSIFHFVEALALLRQQIGR